MGDLIVIIIQVVAVVDKMHNLVVKQTETVMSSLFVNRVLENYYRRTSTTSRRCLLA